MNPDGVSVLRSDRDRPRKSAVRRKPKRAPGHAGILCLWNNAGDSEPRRQGFDRSNAKRLAGNGYHALQLALLVLGQFDSDSIGQRSFRHKAGNQPMSIGQTVIIHLRRDTVDRLLRCDAGHRPPIHRVLTHSNRR